MTSDPSDREREEERPEDAGPGEGAGTADDGADEEGDEERRPISVRDLMPSPSPRPSRRGPGREERRRPEPTEAEEEEATEEASDGGKAEKADTATEEEAGEEEQEEPQAAASVPTPVRVAMDAPPPGDSRPPDELPSRRFELDGEEWIVRITGRTITGTRPDAGALLMHLSFFRPEEPGDPIRRLVTVDRPLETLYPEDLAELFGRSRLAEPEGAVGAEG